MTLSKWEKLSEKAQWDIKVALRGPDSNYGETLKWFTTSVIRGQMSPVCRVGGLVNKDLQLVILPAGRSNRVESHYRSLERYGWNYRHFIDHIRTAAEWLGIPDLLIEPDLWHKVMATDHASQAADDILDAAEDWAQKWAEPTEAKMEKLYAMGIVRSDQVYAPEHVKELIRHFKEGRIAF